MISKDVNLDSYCFEVKMNAMFSDILPPVSLEFPLFVSLFYEKGFNKGQIKMTKFFVTSESKTKYPDGINCDDILTDAWEMR